jgi:phospholipid transport system substrate-binding protein
MFSISLLVLVATAPSAKNTPLEIVKQADSEVAEVLKSKTPAVADLAAKAELFIDFPELAKRALGKEWAKLSKPQQEDFSQTMKGLLRASYAQKAIADGRANTSIEYGTEKLTGNESTVDTKLTVKTDVFPIVYKLYRADAKSTWRIYDVVTDQVSLVSTYSDQFKSVLSKKGFDGLLKTLKTRKESLEKKQ